MMFSSDDESPDESSAQKRSSPRLSLQTRGIKLSDHLHSLPPSHATLEDLSATGQCLPSSHYWQQGLDPSTVDVKLRRIHQYLRSARSLYDIQINPKRPSAVLKMKNTPYGFKSCSTHDVLASFLSPIRSDQVLDAWTPLEIGTFEDAFDRYGKDFHAIAQQMPNKTTRDVIAFYYIWKKHGVISRYALEGEESDAELSDGDYDPSMSAETLKMMEKLKRRQACMKDYLAAARELASVKRVNQLSHKDMSVSDFSLHRLGTVRPAIPSNSVLRTSSVLDSWTPYEIRVFELAMECYGKEFHQVARVVGTKTCREVIAFFYMWKKDPYYQVVKSRWEKKGPSSKKKATPATSTFSDSMIIPASSGSQQ